MTHWVRVVMEKETHDLISNLDFENLDVLEISGSKWGSWPFKSYHTTTYPEFDICKEVTDKKFDLIIAEQVWEHLSDPLRATINVYRMLSPGGFFLNTTPFLLRRHDHPVDCYRWTELGMSNLLQQAGFDESEILVDSWGNRDCAIANLNSWVEYDPGRHSLANEKNYPLVVWALARK